MCGSLNGLAEAIVYTIPSYCTFAIDCANTLKGTDVPYRFTGQGS